MNPLSIHEELVLVLSLGEVQDGHKVIMATEENKGKQGTCLLEDRI